MLALSTNGRGHAAGPGAPELVEPIVATLYGGPLTLHGTGFGARSAGSAIRFTYGSHVAALPATSSLISNWQDGLLEFALPPEVQSGELVVSRDGVDSDSVDLRVYAYDSYNVPSTPGTSAHELAVAVAPDGTLWLNQEFHRALHAFSPDDPPVPTSLPIPQAPEQGIFAIDMFGGVRTPTSTLGEDIAVDGQGRVWFTEGGGAGYQGSLPNTSRLVRYDPESQEFACFNSPINNSEVVGVAIDEARGLAWYAEGGLADGNAITAVTVNSTLSNCSFDPTSATPRDPLCTDGPRDDCHWRFPLPGASRFPAHLAIDGQGDVWFTEFWANAVGKLDPETGEIIELPLPKPDALQGPAAIVGGGPWALSFDANGSLWVNEFFDASILRIRPAVMEDHDCLRLAPEGANPCVEEVFGAYDAQQPMSIHSLALGRDGLVWFGLTRNKDGFASATGSRLGFVAPDDGDAVVLFQEAQTWITGIAQDPVSGDVWLADFDAHKVGRMRQLGDADADGDGVADDSDNCVIMANPDQADANGNGRGDACDRLIDTDKDGCPDAREVGEDLDPTNPWDFFDTPNGDGVRDGRIGLVDILRVLRRYGASDAGGSAPVNRFSSPFGPQPPLPGYSPAFDRSSPSGGRSAGPPDGRITMYDFIRVRSQYGHSCVTS